MQTVPTWGYRSGEQRIFELQEGQSLPEGWYDSPAKIPSDMQRAGTGGERPAAAPAASPAVSPPTIDEQERAEHRRVLAENDFLKRQNEALKARIGDLEAASAGVFLPMPEGGGLPPPPAGEQPPIGEVLDRIGEPDLDTLRARAREMGIKVDNRWGVQRLASEIALAEKAQ
jgi:hypothetical protein